MPDTPESPSPEFAAGEVLQADVFALRKLQRSIREAQRGGRAVESLVTRFHGLRERSRQRLAQRGIWRPRLDWDADLPVAARRQEIADMLRDHQVVVVCGETGSGKSTQLPKILLEMGRGLRGTIGHTQPRRIAARSIAARLAEEVQGRLGQEIGFRIRFTDSSGPNTRVRLMTDGILLAESRADRFLDAYDTIIVDEAHERSLNIDFLLGYLKRLLPRRPDLKLIITSATIDAERFASHFGSAGRPAPVLTIEGRTFPVEVRYRPLDTDPESDADDAIEPRDWQDAVVDAVHELAAADNGHILIFLPTERDIRELTRKLSGLRFRGDTPQQPTEIVPLFGRLSLADQNKVFTPYPHRRLVLATNVAESSLTVPGIRSVIDTGTARISRYAPRTRMQRLPVEPVSQASARQRAGRCGRVGPGVCIRLYSEQDFLSREPFTAPEILRTNLASVILQTLSLRLGPLEEFPFLDPPRITHIREGHKTLHELGAIGGDGQLTDIGRRMARLPVDPRISRILLAAVEEQALTEVLPIAAMLECQDPRERPVDQQQQADAAHRPFQHRDSDFLSILNLWNAWHERQRELSGSQFRRWCQQNFLSWLRLREWADIHDQLRELLEDSDDPAVAKAAKAASGRAATGGRPAPPGAPRVSAGRSRAPQRGRPETSDPERSSPESPDMDFAAIHRALLTGLLANIGCQTPQAEFHGAGGQPLAIWPGSALAAKGAKWFVAAELIETSRRFARTIARVQPEWIEPLAAHLVSREHFEPHWDAAAGNVMIFEKVTLWGLPLVPRRKVPLARVDPVKARELLIQYGLVEFGLLFGELNPDHLTQGDSAAQDDYADEEAAFARGATHVRPGRSGGSRAPGHSKGWATDFPFLRHNHGVLKQLLSLQARTRSHQLLPDDQTQFEFYASRIPDECVDRDRLRRWLQRAAARDPQILQFDIRQFAGEADRAQHAQRFPEVAQFGSMRLPLTYQLDPGQSADGVTVSVPAEGLSQLSEAQLEWLVPGMLEQKLLALIRSLPKDLRRHFVPAPDTAREMAAVLPFGQGDLLSLLASKLSQKAGERFDARSFDRAAVPGHLRFNIRVIDDQGKTVVEGRDLAALHADLQRRAADAVAAAPGGRPAAPPTAPEEAQWYRTGFKTWDFADVPESIEIRRAGVLLKVFPAVRDDGECVALTLSPTIHEANATHRIGLRRLCLLTDRKRIQTHVGNLPQLGQIRLLAAGIRGLEFIPHLSLLMADRAYLHDHPLPRTQVAWQQRVNAGRERLGVVAQEFVQFLPVLFQQYQETRRAVESARGPGWEPLLEDMRGQLAELVTGTFLIDTPWPWLIQFPRYFQALRQRLTRLGSGGLKTELALQSELGPWRDRWKMFQSGATAAQRVDPVVLHTRWLLEEFRVQLFAQKLGTAVPVSAARLDEHFLRLR